MDLSKATQEEVEKLKGTEMGRVNKLFDLWDVDSDGVIDLHELALGMR
jgi:Ca2+-binding EF-hand superfamily protein